MKHVRSSRGGRALSTTRGLLPTHVLAGMALGAVLAIGSAVPASAAATLPTTDRIYAYDCTDGANDLQLLEIQADGTTTAIGTGTGSPGGLCPPQPAWNPKTQKAYFVMGGNLYSTDVSTGVSTVVTPTSGAAGNTSGANNYLTGSPSLAIAPDGTAWVVNEGYAGTIDLATGLVTEITADPNTNRDQGLYYMEAFAYNGTDSKLYVIDADDKTDDTPPIPNQLSVMDQSTGAVTLGAGTTFSSYQDSEFANFYAIAFDSSGRGWLMYVGGNPTISTLKSFDTAGTIDDQGELRIGTATVETYSIFIAQPSSGGGDSDSPVDDDYLDYMLGRVAGENSTDLPDTGGSANTLNLMVGLGCLAVGSAFVAVSRRRRYS